MKKSKFTEEQIVRILKEVDAGRSFYRAPQRRDDAMFVGFWKCFRRLRLDVQSWNHKRVLRVYRQLKLNLPRRICTNRGLPRIIKTDNGSEFISKALDVPPPSALTE